MLIYDVYSQVIYYQKDFVHRLLAECMYLAAMEFLLHQNNLRVPTKINYQLKHQIVVGPI